MRNLLYENENPHGTYHIIYVYMYYTRRRNHKYSFRIKYLYVRGREFSCAHTHAYIIYIVYNMVLRQPVLYHSHIIHAYNIMCIMYDIFNVITVCYYVYDIR